MTSQTLTIATTPAGWTAAAVGVALERVDLLPKVVTSAFLAAVLLLLSVRAAETAVVCTEPLEPICVGNAETYQSNALVERCQSDVEKFVAETDEYVACLEGQTKSKRAQAKKLAEDFRQRVNRNQN